MTKLNPNHQTKYNVYGMKRQSKQQHSGKINFNFIAEMYLCSLKNTKENTKDNYRNHIKQVANNLSAEYLEDIDLIDNFTLDMVETALLKNHSRNTTITVMKTFKRIMAFAVKSGYMEMNPFEMYVRLNKEEIQQYCPTDAEINRIKSNMKIRSTTLEQLRYRVAVLLILDTGNRLNETLKLRWCDFNVDNNGHHKVTMDKSTTKNKKTYSKVISPKVAEMINDLKEYATEDSVYIFETANHKPIPSSNLQRWLAKVVSDINTEISPHSLRRWKATKVYKQTKDIVLVSRYILHHSDIKTTEIYLNLEDTEADNVLYNLFD